MKNANDSLGASRTQSHSSPISSFSKGRVMIVFIAALFVSVAQVHAAAAAPVHYSAPVVRPVMQMMTYHRPPVNWIGMDSPLSGGVLVARAIHEGRIRFPYRPFNE